jgi:hypothetical protein
LIPETFKSILLAGKGRVDSQHFHGSPNTNGKPIEKGYSKSMSRFSRKIISPLLAALFLICTISCDEIPASLRNEGDSEKEIARIKGIIKKTAATDKKIGPLYNPPHATRIPSLLSFGKDAVIADIGAGLGAFEIAMLESQRPFQKLFAVEIDRKTIQTLKYIIDETGLDASGRVEHVLSTSDNVSLPKNSIDLMVLISTPIIFLQDGNTCTQCVENPNDPSAMCLLSMLQALKPGAELHEYFVLSKMQGGFSDAVRKRIGNIYESAGFETRLIEEVSLKEPHYHGVFVKPIEYKEKATPDFQGNPVTIPPHAGS